MLQRSKSAKPKKKFRGLTMVELVFALGLIFVAAGGVMSIIVAGVSWPKRNQFASVRDSLARAKLDETMISGTPPTPAPYTPVSGAPDYDIRVQTNAAPFDPAASVVEVSVRGPRPQQVTSTLKGLYIAPSGALAFQQYGCASCHVLGPTPPDPYYPNLTGAGLNADKDLQNSIYGTSIDTNEYIRQSIRTPDVFVVPGYTVQMTGQPNINSMPAEDLNAISAYIQTF